MIKELWDYSERILNAIGYEGYSCIEYKFDKRDGLYKLLESILQVQPLLFALDTNRLVLTSPGFSTII